MANSTLKVKAVMNEQGNVMVPLGDVKQLVLNVRQGAQEIGSLEACEKILVALSQVRVEEELLQAVA